MQHSKANNAVFIECDFGETGLEGAKLNNALFHQCIMTLARFDKGECREVYFNRNSLRKSQFIDVDLRASEFINNDMTESVFEYCMTKTMRQRPIPSIN